MKYILIFVCMFFTLQLTACGSIQETASAAGTTPAGENHLPAVTEMIAETAARADIAEVSSGQLENKDTAAVNLTIGDKVYQARFYDNKTAKALMVQMPMEFDMEELHGNEKYYYLPDSLPANTENIGSIRAGDIMLFGSDCLVLFYEDFQTTFSYTRIGYLEEPAGLTDSLGSGSIKVSLRTAE